MYVACKISAVASAGLAALATFTACSGPPFTVADCQLSTPCAKAAGGAEPALSDHGGAAGDSAGGAESAGTRPDLGNSPRVVRVTPPGDSVDVDPDVTISVRFDLPLDANTITKRSVRLLRRGSEVKADISYEGGAVRIVPSQPLALLDRYEVSLGTDLTSAVGAALATPFSSSFEVRDGAWETSTVVVDDVTSLPPLLPMSSAGDFALLWSGSKGKPCPVRALDVRRGKPVQPPVDLMPPTGNVATTCSALRVAGNADGVLAAIWSEPDKRPGNWVAQRRAGSWSGPLRVGDQVPNGSSAISVAADGSMTVFADAAVGLKAWQASVPDSWGTSAQALSSEIMTSAPNTAYDSRGDGFAVWRSYDQAGGYERIFSARYRRATGKWSALELVTGSTPNAPGREKLGVPALAVDTASDAMVAWMGSDNSLIASRLHGDSWETPARVGGASSSVPRNEPPGLVFDGDSFWVAWTGNTGSDAYVYTARYDVETGWSGAEKQPAASTDELSARKMPRLATDGRGGFVLVWLRSVASTYLLRWRRHARETWGDVSNVPGGAYLPGTLESDPLPLAMNDSGVAALAWLDFSQGKPKGIRVASFY